MPRFGSVCERIFGTVNTREFVYNLQGNTQLSRRVRIVTNATDPRGQAVWPLRDLFRSLSQYAYEVYDTAMHPALGTSPREAYSAGLDLTGRRLHRMIRYDQEFLVFTMPTTPKGTARVVPSRGVKIRHLYYWCDRFRDPKVEGQPVEVRYDPFDAGSAYAFVREPMGRMSLRILFGFSWSLRERGFAGLTGASEDEGKAFATALALRSATGGFPGIGRGPGSPARSALDRSRESKRSRVGRRIRTNSCQRRIVRRSECGKPNERDRGFTDHLQQPSHTTGASEHDMADFTFPSELLNRPPAERLKYFQGFTMAHPLLQEAKDALITAVEDAAPGSLVFVFGPTGVGKTTLRMRAEQLITEKVCRNSQPILVAFPTSERRSDSSRDGNLQLEGALSKDAGEHWMNP